LRNPLRKILRIVGTKEALARLREESDVPVDILNRAHASGRPEIEALVGPSAVHQGIAVLARTLDTDLADVLERAETTEQACIVVLDQVTDPHNVGAILRSAAAFGALAVIAPDRGAPDESGAMAKSASGALDAIPYIKGVNLVRMLEQLKEQRFWLVGLDADGKKELSQVDLKGRIALVVGAEGEGLRRLVAETCDHMAKLPMTGATESLNVSNAAAVALYEWTRQTRPPG
jgi:23S rRNA (guanosine2251-2'-O)-methyltransferase